MKVTSIKKVTKSEKKFLKKQLATTLKHLALHWIFCGQTALSLRLYDCNAQIICIGCSTVMVGCFKKVKKKDHMYRFEPRWNMF
jgi:hypothetical protein